MQLTINGQAQDLGDIDPEMPLLWALRFARCGKNRGNYVIFGKHTTFVIGGRHHGHIMQVTGRLPWIVSDKNIAWLHNLDRVTSQEMNDGFRHCVDMTRCPGDCLSQHSPLRIKHRCCQVSSFSNAG